MKNKLLIISNNLFSYNNANGKFLKNYLCSCSDDEICNFYISNDMKTSFEQFNSINITDKNALNKFLHRKKLQSTVNSQDIKQENFKTQTSFKHLIRYFVWNTGAWKKCGFKNWIKEQNPTHIVTVTGNNPYLLKISYKLAKKSNIPLITFICEDYPLKNYDFIERKTRQSLSFLLYKHLLKKFTTKVVSLSNLVIFNSHQIKEAYEYKYIIKKSLVCFPPSESIADSVQDQQPPLNFLYAGNLGLNRIDALIDFALFLKTNSFDQTINVYSNLSEENKLKLQKIDNVKVHDFVRNEELQKIIKESGVLLHLEYDSEYNKTDLKYAFSTKLADLICSNKRIFLYAPKGLVESEYFLKYLPKNIATSKEELKETLDYVLSDHYDYLKQMDLAKNNHNIEITSALIRKEIEQL